MVEVRSRFVDVYGARTHYFEAGEGDTVVLLHDGGFGACAELCWEYNIKQIAEHFRVVAPDWLGFGKSAKIFDFDNPIWYRVDHMTRFLNIMAIDRAHFVANSMGGSFLLMTAAKVPCPWPINKLVAISGGGYVPNNEYRQILNAYGGTEEQMGALLAAGLSNPAVYTNPGYITRRNELAHEPGSWECTAAARFKAPWLKSSGTPPPVPDYSTIDRPVLLITGGKDKLREANFGPTIQKLIPGSELHIVPKGGHCAQIDEPEETNRVVLEFLTRS